MKRDGGTGELFGKLKEQADAGGYNLNADMEFTLDLVEGLLVNLDRYGYMSCPCRLAAGSREEDLDIICPCDYRDSDLSEYGACYCGLYVSDDVMEGKRQLMPVPERRPPDPSLRGGPHEVGNPGEYSELPYPVFRCSVCGYLCARDQPPGKCPICGVSSDRFQRFM